MPFVLDASVTLCWVFQDQATAFTEAVRMRLRDEAARVSAIWALEVANAVVVGQRRGRVAKPEVLLVLAQYNIEAEALPSAHVWGPVLNLARTQGLSAYDASYLELAWRQGLPLATLDSDLRTAAARIGVPLVG